jgi:hypothetical protein
MRTTSLIALFVSSLSIAACGGGEGGGSGVDGSKNLTALSDAEIIEICEYSESLIDQANSDEVSCYVTGIFQASETEDCQTIADACIADSVPEEGDCNTAPDDALPSCASDVTVSEMESCLSAQASQINSISIDCETTVEELSELSEQPLPAACAAVEEKCPDLFDDEVDA